MTQFDPVIRPTAREIAELMGGPPVLGCTVNSMADLHHAIHNGVESGALFHLVDTLAVPLSALAKALALSEIKQYIIEGRDDWLEKSVADRLCRLAYLGVLAIHVLNDQAAAGRWLVEAQRGLDGQTPLELTATHLGTLEVEALLMRLQHDFYA